MSRWRQGWDLTKKSWAVLKSHRELMRFPIYGALIAMALVIVLVGPGVYLIDDGQRVIGGLLVALGLYGSSFVSVYFGVALAATADLIFKGQPATIADGFAVARSHTGAIAGWAALAALVGTLISLIQQSGSIGEAAAGDEHHPVGERVGVDRPLDRADVDVEVLFDRRQGDVERGEIVGDDEHAKPHREEGHVRPRRTLLSRHRVHCNPETRRSRRTG